MAFAKRGLVHVYTGDGKGKTTAAVGLAVRAAGAGMRVAFVQFVKGGARSSELGALERLGVRVERPAERSTGLLG
ncbi:MAG: cob(I)yrinic acid a,c-diamide adenosyltransferase, partial [Actinomycetota bacterium]|nr:cob(I)yrinic acid a,c-diamide adenosyltransferase [Actinomycetota bacterium]